MKSTYKIFITLSIIPQWLFVQWAANNPLWIETHYSLYWYPKLYAFSQFFWSSIPISIGDLGYLALAIWIISKLRYLRKIKTYLDLGVLCAFVYFIFHVQWGLNYHRVPLNNQLDLPNGYTTEELITITEHYIQKTNELQKKITKNDTIAVSIPYSNKDVFRKSQQAIQLLYPKWVLVPYNRDNVKASLFSTGLSYMGYGGYLNPFTLEAQVNAKTPLFSRPTTSCHEIAHQLGYAAENEANFIGILACINSRDIYFQYTGNALGIRYLLRELFNRNPKIASKLSDKIAVGVKKNFNEIADFWKSYENPLEPYFKKTFDSYLKANHQKSGIESYNLVVDLIVNYHKTQTYKQ